jgi:hypothetical protein
MTHHTSLSDADLVAATKDLVRRSNGTEADLLEHLAEIDARKLYLERAFPSMFAFCVAELGFSEDAAYYRITVARAARRWPAVLDSLRSGAVHLAGLRLLAPHLSDENHRELLASAAGKPKREIEEMLARFAPLPPVATVIRRVPEAPALELVSPAGEARIAVEVPRSHRPKVEPVAEETFRIHFTAGAAFRDKLKQAQDLLRHRVPTGDVPKVFELALDALIERVEKERFAKGRKPRRVARRDPSAPVTRHIPAAMEREVYERDGARCTYVDERGNRCPETCGLEIDHVKGFARTREHRLEDMRLLCRAHNQHAAEKMYGREFMEGARAARRRRPTRPGASGPSGKPVRATPGKAAGKQVGARPPPA